MKKINSVSSTFQVIKSKESGATRLALLFARKLKLDHCIDAYNIPWREEVLSIVIERLLFPSDIALKADRIELFVEILANKEAIEKNIADVHLDSRCAVLYPITTKDPEGTRQILQAVLLTNPEGCPFGVEVCSSNNDEIQSQLIHLLNSYKLKALLIVGHSLDSEEKNIEVVHPSQVTVHQLLKGCILIQTETDEKLNTEEMKCHPLQWSQAVREFSELFSENQAFEKSMLTAQLFVNMLASYLSWHMNKTLEKHIEKHAERKVNWTLRTILERLKSIRSQTVQFENMMLEDLKNRLDSEQAEIISIFGVSREEFEATHEAEYAPNPVPLSN